MENFSLISDLKCEGVDGSEIAMNFINKNLSEIEININLTNLLKDSCGIHTQLSPEFVENEQYDDIAEFFEKHDGSIDSSVDLCNSNFYNRCVKFFETVIAFNTKYFTEDGQLHSYLFHLTDLLSDSTSLGLRVTCFTIQLKFVTGYIKHFNVLKKNLPENVFRFAIQILKKAISHSAVQCQISALYELQRWIELNQEFAEDEYLRLIPWCLKLSQPKVVCISLKVACKILNMEQLRKKRTLFVIKLLEVFTDLIRFDNLNIFENIIRCCEIICLYHRELLKSSFIDIVLDNLYAKNRDKAKITARFWVNSIFSDSVVANIRRVIEFLSDAAEFLIELVVDAMIEVYHVFIDWELLACILMDQGEEQLSIQEKGDFITILKCIVEEVIAGVPPEERNEGEYEPDLAQCSASKKELTKYFTPALIYLLDLIFPDELRTKCNILHIGKYLDFEMLDADVMKLLIEEGYWIFEVARESEFINASLQFMCAVYTSDLSESTRSQCSMYFDELVPNCVTEFQKLIDDLLEDPDRYNRLEDRKTQDEACLVLLRVQAINWEYYFETEITYEIPTRILCSQICPNNPIFMLIERVCIYLMTEYCVHTIFQIENNSKHVGDISEIESQILEIIKVIDILTCKIQDDYATDLGEIAFHAICRILTTVKANLLKDLLLPEMYPMRMKHLMTYVLVTSCGISTAVCPNKSITRKTIIINKILELVLSDVLVPACVYDIFTCIGNYSDRVRHVVKNFFLALCKKKGDRFLSDWILEWLKGLHKSPHSHVTSVRHFAEIIMSIKYQIRNVMYAVQIDGLNHARIMEPTSCLKFLELLSKLCLCLREADKRKVSRYLLERRDNFNMQFLNHYKDFLKDSHAVDSIVGSPSTSSADSTHHEEEFFLVTTPDTSYGSSSGNNSNSNDGNADESDLHTSPRRSRIFGANRSNAYDHTVFDFACTGITSEGSNVGDVIREVEQLKRGINRRKGSTSSTSQS